MGYSINVIFKSVEQRDEMLKFLEEHYRTWEEVANLESPTYVRGPTDDPSYGPKNKPVIGFDYVGGAEDRKYAWLICCWMARMTGRRSINYDGHETLSLEEMKANEVGFFKSNRSFDIFDMLGFSHTEKLLRSELERLTELWQARKTKRG